MFKRNKFFLLLTDDHFVVLTVLPSVLLLRLHGSFIQHVDSFSSNRWIPSRRQISSENGWILSAPSCRFSPPDSRFLNPKPAQRRKLQTVLQRNKLSFELLSEPVQNHPCGPTSHRLLAAVGLFCFVFIRPAKPRPPACSSSNQRRGVCSMFWTRGQSDLSFDSLTFEPRGEEFVEFRGGESARWHTWRETAAQFPLKTHARANTHTNTHGLSAVCTRSHFPVTLLRLNEVARSRATGDSEIPASQRTFCSTFWLLKQIIFFYIHIVLQWPFSVI